MPLWQLLVLINAAQTLAMKQIVAAVSDRANTVVIMVHVVKGHQYNTLTVYNRCLESLRPTLNLVSTYYLPYSRKSWLLDGSTNQSPNKNPPILSHSYMLMKVIPCHEAYWWVWSLGSRVKLVARSNYHVPIFQCSFSISFSN